MLQRDTAKSRRDERNDETHRAILALLSSQDRARTRDPFERDSARRRHRSRSSSPLGLDPVPRRPRERSRGGTEWSDV